MTTNYLIGIIHVAYLRPIYVETNGHDFFCFINTGMRGEGKLYVGGSEVNGAPSREDLEKCPDLLNRLNKVLKDIENNHSKFEMFNGIKQPTRMQVMECLDSVIKAVGDEYNAWLGAISSGKLPIPDHWGVPDERE